ncbi:hypothetical protein CGZ98_17740 [Enemella evansiae]|uniref:bifunctional diaminohydroxyphosphoribosylaminopyrimidine deaminase/5-amino-6-(5-phosphoribosylamino)uracil reductase RibD n=1 Tax=Enemella evansiae TaxID=2016499 RepID=UPI000B976547|nr:hypothetical protein CGZ98_17740 [Enemella evansiae]
MTSQTEMWLDLRRLRRAAALALHGPLPDPNPRVGAVICDPTGSVVGEGWHRGAGTEHAEIAALRAAGASARGGTAYVTLEPCAHTGRTGPCVRALIEAGIARVVYARSDPNPAAAGGAQFLTDAGVAVARLDIDAADLNPHWEFAVRNQRPFVTWKYAATLDGRSAAADGSSRWITGPEARAEVGRQRSECDAILVGTGTVLADDPWLTARHPDGTLQDGQPLRVVLGERPIPATARVLDEAAETLLLRHRDPERALAELHERGIRHLWLEGGPRVAAAFWRAGLVDELIGYLAPALLGGGRPALDELGIPTMAEILRFDEADVAPVGADLRVTARPRARAHRTAVDLDVPAALDALRAGRPVLVTDDADRENEGDIVLAADTLTDEWLAWTIRHSSGYVCAPLSGELADRLELPLMVPDNRDPLRTAYTITVDAATGVGTGISAADRVHTLRTLAAAGHGEAGPADLIRPGHVVPLRARDGGVLTRRGHTEAAVDLCRLAGLAPVAAIAELVNDDGTMMRTDAIRALAERSGLGVLTIADLAAWRRSHDRVELVAETRIPTAQGEFAARGYRDLLTGAEHLVLHTDRLGPQPLVRVHSECLTGDVFGSRRCDCGPQLDAALAEVAAAGGLVVYLGGHEGRGVGLLDKLRAYAEQDAGADTVQAQTRLGLPVDAREYGAAAAILGDLGIDRISLLSNNPAKAAGLTEAGIEVAETRPLRAGQHPDNLAYLRTKAARLGHRTLLHPADELKERA